MVHSSQTRLIFAYDFCELRAQRDS